MTTTRTGRIDSTKSSTCLQLQYNNVGFSGKEAIPFTVKGPIPVHLPESNGDYAGRTGCSIMELSFQYPCQIGELVFCNYYTAWMSVFVKRMTNKIKSHPPKEKEISPCTNYRARPMLERSFSIDIPAGKEKCKSRSPLPKLPSPPNSCKESKILRRPSTASMTPDDEFEPLDLKMEALATGCLQQMSFSKRRHSSGSLSTETAAVSETRPWELSIEMKNLMPWPHFECGSQDLVSIPATENYVGNLLKKDTIEAAPASSWFSTLFDLQYGH
ncbi:unnamed protein product [Allacma fusca]|uniref:Uncharacterized protein n=1 Tax=Allacma fusca TaxID=39272 RepID=A0A8J2LFX7_9HEXA|nr:unnamed protein product [Allacma fusca]